MLDRLDGMYIATKNKVRTKVQDFVAKKHAGINGLIVAVGLILVSVILIWYFKSKTQPTLEKSIDVTNDKIGAITNEISK